jgi:hypothetical protein
MVQLHKRTLKEYYLLRSKEDFDKSISNILYSKLRVIKYVGTRADPRFNTQERTNKSLTTGPFGNTCEAHEVSPEVEAGVVAGLKCLQT